MLGFEEYIFILLFVHYRCCQRLVTSCCITMPIRLKSGVGSVIFMLKIQNPSEGILYDSLEPSKLYFSSVKIYVSFRPNLWLC